MKVVQSYQATKKTRRKKKQCSFELISHEESIKKSKQALLRESKGIKVVRGKEKKAKAAAWARTKAEDDINDGN